MIQVSELKEVAEIIEENAAVSAEHNGASGLILRPTHDHTDVGVEFVRYIGHEIIRAGYYISGIREHTDQSESVEVWIDSLDYAFEEESRTEVVGMVTLDPITDGGRELLQELQESHTLEADTVHDDGNITFRLVQKS